MCLLLNRLDVDLDDSSTSQHHCQGLRKLVVIVGRGQLDSFTSFLDQTSAQNRALSGQLPFDKALLPDDHIVCRHLASRGTRYRQSRSAGISR